MTERVALITGASSGLGEAAAHRLARAPGLRLVLLARRADRLRALAAAVPAPATWLAVDLLDPDAPARARAHLDEHHGRLDLLVNNAGAGGRGAFADTGADLVRQTMELNFFAQVRLTEALLTRLRDAAPSAIVNVVASTSARLGRARVGAYSASKAAFAVWSDSLRAEEHAHGVHVGTVMPGFIPTEGFPQRELAASRATRWMLGTPEQVADAIAAAGLDRRAEVWVPRYYGGLAALRTIAPGLVRRAMASSRADVLATATRRRGSGGSRP